MKILRRYVISSIYTFLAGALLVGYALLVETNYSWEAIGQTSFWVGLASVCWRAGVKAVGEYLIPQIPILVKWLKSKI